MILNWMRGYLSTIQFSFSTRKRLPKSVGIPTFIRTVSLNISQIDERMIEKARNFLLSNLQNVSDTYTVSVVGYALHLLKIPNASDLISGLRSAKRAVDDDYEWQNSPSSVVPSPFDWLYEKDKRSTDDDQLNMTKSKALNNFRSIDIVSPEKLIRFRNP